MQYVFLAQKKIGQKPLNVSCANYAAHGIAEIGLFRIIFLQLVRLQVI